MMISYPKKHLIIDGLDEVQTCVYKNGEQELKALVVIDENNNARTAQKLLFCEKTPSTFAYATLADGDATNDVPAISFSGTVTPAGSRVYMAYLPTGVKITDVTEEDLKTAMMHLTNNTTDNEESEIYADSDSDGNWAVDVGTVKSSGTYVAVVFGTDTSIEMTAKAQRNWNGEYIAAKIVGLDTGKEYTIDLGDYENDEFYLDLVENGEISSTLNAAMFDKFQLAIEGLIDEAEGNIVIYGDIVLEASSEMFIGADEEYVLNCVNITIASSPNADDTTEGNNVAGEVENLFEYSKLTIIGDLSFSNTLLVAGNQQAGSPLSGALTGSYGALEIKDGTLTLDGGALYARGKVYGDGEIVNNGAIYQPFIIHDWPGLEKALEVYNAGVFPFSLYEFYNMEIKCSFDGSGLLYGQMCVEVEGSGETLSSEIGVINTDVCLLQWDYPVTLQRVDGVQKITSDCIMITQYIFTEIYGISSADTATPFGYNLEIELNDEDCGVETLNPTKLLPGFKLAGNIDAHDVLYVYDKDSYVAAYNAADWASESETEITYSWDFTDRVFNVATTDPTFEKLYAIVGQDISDSFDPNDGINADATLHEVTLPEYDYEQNEVVNVTFYYYYD